MKQTTRVSTPAKPVTVALLGNPNTGKSTLFTALVGVRQRTGNFPGVTVESKIGRTQLGGQACDLIDLPGTYSLVPHSPDEMLAVDVLLGRRDDLARVGAVLCIVDASNLARNLYLVSQILELGLPTVIALNMTDLAERKGLQLDASRLQQNLGVPVVAVQANRQVGLGELRAALAQAIEQPESVRRSPLPDAVQQEVNRIQAGCNGAAGSPLPRYLVERLLLDTGYLEAAHLDELDSQFWQAVHAARERLTAGGQSLAALETIARYQWVGQVMEGAVEQRTLAAVDWTDRLDHVLTHRFWGTLVFALLMLLVFQSIFSWAGWFMQAINGGFERLGTLVANWVPPGALQSLLIDGVIGGVGGMLSFLPQIFILFLFIAVLEDCGYMARAAYLMDKLMSRIGLSGKSFIPLLSSFACAIPGMMATRVIENRRDRLVTILIAPLMTCSARLPVYTLLIGAFIPQRAILGGLVGLPAAVLLGLYLLGLLAAVGVAVVLRKTILPGETPPFVMELPSYKIPEFRVVLQRMLESGWEFLYRAGTLILAVTVVVWAAAYYPRDTEQVESPFCQPRAALQERLERFHQGDAAVAAAEIAAVQAELRRIDNQIAGAHMRHSYLGRLGRWIEPLVKPLGWDWKIGCAVIASFPAREVVVGTLGVIYNLGDDSQGSLSLQDGLQQATWDGSQRPVFNIPVALSIMVFFALCAQCVSTLVVMRRETNSWRWPALAFGYMTAMAYLGALVTYQIGSRLGAHL